MALQERTRRWWMRLSAAVLLIAASLYVGLCLGRPLYYTDGSRELAGSQLAASGMLQWRTPEAVAEVPGPVSGRIVALPDGRWCYGRIGADGTADLVVWHPDRPAVPPEPLVGCNTEHNELAPALTADGRLWFASDRPGGAGGYDLYVVERWNAGAAAVTALAACNTALDETDPTLPRDGSELVFVRSDRAIDRGNDGTLWHWQVGADVDPAPLYPPGRPGQRPVRRDPAFAADGAALWFVQKRPGQLLELLRASRRGTEWAPPLPFAADWGSGELRAPLPDADGRRLWLLSPQQSEAGKQLLYASSAHEVYPWWPGQRWLEWLLLGVIGTCVLLLLLLHFGRRWSALDLLAQCLLLSLLLHVLLFLWLMGVEISGAMLPGDDDGGMQVSVQLSSATAATAAGGAGSDVSATVQFTPRERDLSAAAPLPSALPSTAAAASVAAAPGEYRSELAPAASSVAVAVADAPAAIEVERGVDAPSAQPAAAVAIEVAAPAAAEPSATTARTASGTAPIAVTAPGSGVQRAAVVAPALAGTAQRELPAASESPPSPTPSAIVLQDAPAESAPAVASASAEAAPAAAVLPAASSGPVAPNQAAPSSAEAPRRSAQPGIAAASAAAATVRPGSALARGAAVMPAAAAAQLPTTRSGGAAAAAPAPELRDAGAAIEAATPVRAAAEPAAVGPVALVPAATAPARNQSAPIAASRQLRGTQPSTAPTPLPRPGSALVRGGSLAAGTAMAGTLPAAPSGRTAVVEAPKVADAPVAGTGPAPRATAVPSDRTARPLAAAPSSASAPRSSALERPVRRSAVGELALAEARPTPPATRLPRPRSAPVAPGAAVVAPPAASAYSNRFGPAKVKALEQFGGSDATERAVQNGLRYLARMQHRDGAWGDRTDYDSKYGFVYVGKSALCLLAFLGAGHTPTSRTEFSDHVQRGIAHLLALQDENGAFGPSSCYGHGIATYALAECYGLTKAAELVTPLERALTWILDHQGPRRDARNRGGWGYFSPGLQAEDSYARVSVSSWMIMALESARLSGVELPDDVLPRAREFLELAYDKPNGWFRYNHKPSRLNSAWPTLPASTPAAAFCLQLLGAPAGDPMVEAAVAYTVERRPQAYRRYDDDDFVLRGQGNVYFWYYGTLCCFLRGGDAWTQWNQRLVTVLPKAQAADGSFPPIDVYAEEAGDTRTDRSYTTAMCVLCLEVYYRYFTPLLVGR